MQTVGKKFPWSAALVLLVAGLAACVPGGPPLPDTSALEARAESLEAAGDYQAAAREWESIAGMSAGQARNRAYINAARNLHALERDTDALRLLEAIPAPPEGSAGVEYALLYAAVANASGDPETALAKLNLLPPDIGGADLARALALRADAQFALGQTATAVGTLVAREKLLGTPVEVAENQRLIWNRLQQATTAGADLSTPPDANPVVAGWLELGRLARSAGGDPSRMRGELEQWKSTHPTHPASRTLVNEIIATYAALTAYPRRVALILPLQGPLAASSAAVRDGFLAAYFGEPEDRRPEVLILDTSVLGASGAWERAAEQGADFIVGPLSKDEVAELRAVSGGVTTLALNEPSGDGNLPGFVYQFPLAPEDEAAQAARKVLDDNLYRGVAMVPANDWGMRIAESFGETLQAEGGRLLEVRTYVSGLPDYSQEITALLHVDDSEARHQRLENALGMSLDFEPRRRQDADFVFLAALPQDGKQIAPQLRFHYAFDLPVYATSAIYQPGAPPGDDLDGVQFDDMPWILSDDGPVAEVRNQMSSVWPAATGRRARLYALGHDAYTLVPLLRSAPLGGSPELQALTGTLSLTDTGRVARGLDWARVVNGQIRTVSPPSR